MPKIAIVNEKDEVIGAVSEEELYERNHLHRIVHILLFDEKGRIMLQKRSKTKSYAPSCWVTSAGGRVDEGETYEMAAYRELKEEIGMCAVLEEIGKYYYEHKESGVNYFMTIYKAEYRGESLVLQESEVEAVEFCTLAKINELIRDDLKITNELKFVIENVF